MTGRLTWRLWALMLIALLLAAPAWTIHGLPVGLADLAVAGTVLAYLLQRRPVRPTLLFIASTLWIGALALSLHSALHLDSALRVVRIGEGLALLLLSPLNLRLSFEDVKWWFLGAGSLSLLIGLVDFATGRNLGASSGSRPLYLILRNHAFLRPGGVFGDAAQLGTVAAIVILVSLMSMFWSGRWGFVAGIAGLGLGGFLLSLTASRSALVFLGLAIAVVLVLDDRRRRMGLTVGAALLLAGAGLVIIHPAAMTDFVQQRIEQADPSTGRFERWATIWRNFWHMPGLWLTGLGYKTFSDNPQNNVLIRGYSSPYPFYSVDNTYLSALVETGLIGFAALVGWIAAIGLEVLRASRGRLQTLTLALFLGLLGEGFTVDALTYYRLIGLLALLVAVMPRPAARLAAA